MSGGMTMVGDMFNNNAKMLVDNICSALSESARTMPYPQSNTQNNFGGSFQSQSSGGVTQNSWQSSSNWPAELGSPSTSGAQNSMRYAYFPQTNRLAVDRSGSVTIYDTLNHQIGGVSQQQGGDQSLTFSSQFGTIAVSDLPVVTQDSQNKSNNAPPQNNFAQAPIKASAEEQFVAPESTDQSFQPADNNFQSNNSNNNNNQVADPFAMLQKVKDLFDAGVLNEEEYTTKKAEILKRI